MSSPRPISIYLARKQASIRAALEAHVAAKKAEAEKQK